jgi:hypothetical protein
VAADEVDRHVAGPDRERRQRPGEDGRLKIVAGPVWRPVRSASRAGGQIGAAE